MIRSIVSVALFSCVAAAVDAAAQISPADALNARYEQVRAIVAQEKGRLSEHQIDDKLKQIIAPMFDFEELSRRSLGAYWKKGTPSQQKEFVERFSDLLARTYMRRITRGVELIEVRSVKEKIDGDKATVVAVVMADGTPVSTEARLLRKPDGWKIYDVAVEGIGLVNNYRNEFPGIVRKEGFQGLIERLKNKQKLRAAS